MPPLPTLAFHPLRPQQADLPVADHPGLPEPQMTAGTRSAPDPRTRRPHGGSTGKSSCRQAARIIVADQLTLAHLDSLASELAAHSRPKQADAPPDWKRLAAELAAARANVVRLVSKQVITEEDAARQLTEFKRDEEMLEARRARWEREQTTDTEEARRATFAKLTEYRSVWSRLSPAPHPVPKGGLGGWLHGGWGWLGGSMGGAVASTTPRAWAPRAPNRHRDASSSPTPPAREQPARPATGR
jgi:uncharacterized membrane protein YccC